MKMISLTVVLAVVCSVSASADYKHKRGVAGIGLAGYAFPATFPASAGVAPHPSFLTTNPLTASVPAVGSLVSPKGSYFPSAHVPSIAFAAAPYLAKPAYATSAYAPAIAAPAYSTHAYAPAPAHGTPVYAGHAAHATPVYAGHAAPAAIPAHHAPAAAHAPAAFAAHAPAAFAAHAPAAFAAHAPAAFAAHAPAHFAAHPHAALAPAFAKAPFGFGYYG